MNKVLKKLLFDENLYDLLNSTMSVIINLEKGKRSFLLLLVMLSFLLFIVFI